MTSKSQRSRILRMAAALQQAEALRQDGSLELVARLWEEQRTVFLELEQEVVLAYSIAVGEYEAEAEPWGR